MLEEKQKVVRCSVCEEQIVIRADEEDKASHSCSDLNCPFFEFEDTTKELNFNE